MTGFAALSRALERMRRFEAANAGLVDFEVAGPLPYQYRVTLRCRSVSRRGGTVTDIDVHQVDLTLTAGFPYEAPIVQWRTAIFHPNISAPGVCLHGHWTPESSVDTLCVWLWDMARYQTYNLQSVMDPAARDWVKSCGRSLPLDTRGLRALDEPPPVDPEVIVILPEEIP
jgi:hypothetical protein